MKKNILIINNNIDDTKEIADRLENASTNIFTAANIQDALSIFVKKEFCLIILDALLSSEDDHKLLSNYRNEVIKSFAGKIRENRGKKEFLRVKSVEKRSIAVMFGVGKSKQE